MANTNAYSFVSLFKDPIPHVGGTKDVISSIMIPRIQRPYAQGRPDMDATMVRKNFLDQIFLLLKGSEEKLDLNFVYGKVERLDGLLTMQPLDGQQRLTTLFLLHWYLLVRGKIPGGHKEEVKKSIGSFTYATRDTSASFCKVLSSCDPDRLEINGERKPRKALDDRLDFFYSYAKDPTVSAMLAMLDAIHDKFEATCRDISADDIWARLDKIRFRVVSLTEYKLSEELYIKMNARGLPLTAFECFKADFLGLMDLERHSIRERANRRVELDSGKDVDPGAEDTVTFKQRFGIRLDTAWCDLFWDEKNPARFDRAYMAFFSRYFTSRFALEHDSRDSEWETDFKEIHDNYDTDDRKLAYQGIRPFQRMVERFGDRIDYFGDLAGLLDVLKRQKEDVLAAMKPLWGDEQPDWFCNPDTSFAYPQIATMSAVIEFAHLFPKFPMDLFSVWMKSVNCIVENTDINDQDSLSSAVRRLHDLLERIAEQAPRSVHAFVAAMAGINERDLTPSVCDEVLKAKRIARQVISADEAKRWAEEFDQIAIHPFLKGMIGFFYSSDMTIDEFSAHSALIRSLFDKDGISPPYRAEPHWLLRAAVSQLTEVSHINKRHLTETNETNKYLKNLVSSVGNATLKERMHTLFAVQLKGLRKGPDGCASDDVRKKLEEVIREAPQIPTSAPWDLRETLRVLREDAGFYKWALQQGNDLRVYWNYNQYQARAKNKKSCLMLPVFRIAEEFAIRNQMTRLQPTNGRDGFDSALNMFVGQDLRMRKPMANFQDVDAEVRFRAGSYPVELWVSWQNGAISPNEEQRILAEFNTTDVISTGERREIRIEEFQFSLDSANGCIDTNGLAAKVGQLVNRMPQRGPSAPQQDLAAERKQP